MPLSKTQAACIAGGLVLYAVLKVSTGLGGQESAEGGALKRAGPGDGEKAYEILVSGLDGEETGRKIPVEITVRDRKYTSKEASDLFNRILPELTEQMLGENDSLEEVRTNLDLENALGNYGFTIRWESEDPELIDSFGNVHNEELTEEGRSTWLRAKMGDGVHEHIYEFPATVYPPSMTSEKQAVSAFQKWADRIDSQQQTEDSLTLPRTYNGRSLDYSLPQNRDYRMFPVLGLLSAVLLYLKEESDKRKHAQKREQLLLLDYSEVVSKLAVYIGAGLTVRGAWERTAASYKEGVRQRKRSVRPVYEEMVRTAGQISSGVSEGKAYGEFGKRCGLQSYLKLSALLEQSQKNGSRQLRSSLGLEMAAAFEQRKNLAKKLGEEAGTKLLFPLFLMLGVVMVMVVVPAFLSFY